jgi:23S rRNA-/tRNA-specific pseudouridylate synthase
MIADWQLLHLPWDELFVVEGNYNGWRLDLYLTQKIHRASRSQITRILKSCDVRLNERPARPADRVRAADTIRIARTERIDPQTPSLDTVQILTDEHDVVIVDKPSGMLVHRTAGEVSRTVEAWTQTLDSPQRLDPTHRLDRETSGCLVLGRGLDRIRELRAVFDHSLATKTYLAVLDDIEQRWQPGCRRTFDTPLGDDTGSSIGLRMGPGNLPCATHVHCFDRRGRWALTAVNIDQGRQHQIRAHVALFGTPVAGDKLYGMGDAFFAQWLEAPGRPDLVQQVAVRWHALHAWHIEVPVSSGVVVALAPIPASITGLVGTIAFEPLFVRPVNTATHGS